LSQDTENAKGILLRFCSSELTSHAGNIIGFSVILFSYLSVASRFFPDIASKFKFYLQNPITNKLEWLIFFCSVLVIFLILSVITTAIIFALFRLCFYGRCSHQTIMHKSSTNTVRELWKEISKEVEDETVFGIPLIWFSRGIADLPTGFAFSVGLSLIVSLVFLGSFLLLSSL